MLDINRIMYPISRKYFPIQKISKNLLTLKLHYIYAVVLTILALLLDQIKHIVLEVFSDKIGPGDAFQLWLLYFPLEYLGVCAV